MTIEADPILLALLLEVRSLPPGALEPISAGTLGEVCMTARWLPMRGGRIGLCMTADAIELHDRVTARLAHLDVVHGATLGALVWFVTVNAAGFAGDPPAPVAMQARLRALLAEQLGTASDDPASLAAALVARALHLGAR